ncbi:MAG: hypothetical protein RR620_09470 [Clostridium sp.]
MILKELSRKEGIAFIQLVLEFVKMDNVLTKEEEYKVDDYLKELHLTREDLAEITFTESLCLIKEATPRIQNIIYFELMGLALVDGDYEDHEVGFLEELANSLKISRAAKFKYANFYYEFMDSYESSNNITDDEREAFRKRAIAII